MLPILGTLGLILCVWVGFADAQQPKSVFDLLNRVPDPPSTARESLRWFDKEGHLGHAVVLALKDDIEQYRKSSEQLAHVENEDEGRAFLILGLEHVGIDAARLQSDPIYSANMKASLDRMTMEEKLALAQKIMEPSMTSQSSDGASNAKELQAVLAAVKVAETFPQRRTAWQNGMRVELVRNFEEMPALVPQQVLAKSQPTTNWNSPECKADCVSQWKDYGLDLWPLILERETEILRKRRAVLQYYKTFLAEEFMQEGNTQLGATLYGRLALTPDNRRMLANYHQGLLEEISGLIELTETAAKRAAEVVHGGVEKFYIR
ncbi:MAG: hypothetical protein AB7P17_15210 [Nitrospirales bacterium]|nr:hypothetical protein [Nitrospirales bacterium]